MSVNKVNSDGSLTRIAGGIFYADAPIGTILPYGGDTAPAGFLICDGAAVSRSTYSELFGAIGTSFGPGNGSTTFNVPDLREAVPVGAGTSDRSAITTHDTYDVGQFKDDRFQNHSHFRYYSGTNGSFYAGTAGVGPWTPSSDSGQYGNTTGSSSDGRSGSTTHGKQLGVNYIIKAKQVPLPVDLEEAAEEAGKEAAEEALKVTGGTAVLSAGLSGSITWHKSGKIVDVLINNVRNENGTISAGAVLATGMPEPLYNTSVFTSRYPNESNVIDIVSGSTPQFRQTGMYSVAQGIGLFGTFAYFCAD